jgi:hypothetical protein
VARQQQFAHCLTEIIDSYYIRGGSAPQWTGVAQLRGHSGAHESPDVC